jgi:hypothetical protein
VDIAAVDAILEDHDHDPGRMLAILEATQEAFGYLPVGALKRISERTGAWYAQIYGTASFYGHLRLGAPEVAATAGADAAYLALLAGATGGTGGTGGSGRASGAAS